MRKVSVFVANFVCFSLFFNYFIYLSNKNINKTTNLVWKVFDTAAAKLLPRIYPCYDAKLRFAPNEANGGPTYFGIIPSDAKSEALCSVASCIWRQRSCLGYILECFRREAKLRSGGFVCYDAKAFCFCSWCACEYFLCFSFWLGPLSLSFHSGAAKLLPRIDRAIMRKQLCCLLVYMSEKYILLVTEAAKLLPRVASFACDGQCFALSSLCLRS